MFKDLGDFQTPLSLVEEVINCLSRMGKQWTRVLEPTCGQGNFIVGLLNSRMPLQEIQGVELQDEHVRYARTLIKDDNLVRVVIQQSNIFDLDFRSDLRWKENGSLLVIGNPPWVTNAALSILQSENVPVKTNFKGLSGFDAMTGRSNFDIAEYIFLKLIFELASERPTIALLCKTLVARNILKFAADTGLPISHASIRKINSKKNFAAFVDACLFCVDVGFEYSQYQAEVYDDLYATEPSSVMGIVGKQLVSDMDANRDFAFLDGECSLVWRQGLKHDAVLVAELTYGALGELQNKLGEIVLVEQNYVYPLLKSSDLGGKEKERPKRAVIVTQSYIGEDTSHLEHDAPKLWEYLITHKSEFDRRKSSIYKGQPLFSIFGIGSYSFSHYKVAISGLYKSLKFVAVGPIEGRPVMFDDTCYFLACESANQAALVVSLLNDTLCLGFIHSVIFWDAKRPVTKKLLQRINLSALLDRIDKQALLARANAEFRRLTASESERSPVWPSNLEDLLRNNASHVERFSCRKAPATHQASQMSMLEI